jgi:hypothetical protein
MEDKRIELQDFLRRLNSEPEVTELDRTADGKAKTLPISFVEMTLDELYLGIWGTNNFTTKFISNEVVGELELWVKHPITGDIITRSGAAGIIIQMDKAPDNLTGQEKNNWALNPSNKKPNALDLGYPKLKAECVKNAAQSLGKIFGRDLNRKKNDKFNAAYKELSDAGFKALLERIESGDWKAVQLAESNFTLSDIQKSVLEGHKPKQLTNGSV